MQKPHTTTEIVPTELLQPRRKIVGMSAILLPFLENGEVDWDSFRGHVQRTVDAGLAPAVNMDTGYANLIDAATRETVLRITQEVVGNGEYVAGAFVADQPESKFQIDTYREQIDLIHQYSGTPIIFQSYGLAHQSDEAIVGNYSAIAAASDRFLAFELGTMFAPFGKIYSLSVYEQLMKLPQCVGAKHSSLRRDLEWDRLRLRDATRADFKVLTGNDLAIDMVMYGSDYLLGLSTFAPDLFAERDRLWASGDQGFYELNDLLQYLGFFAFRAPVPAYRHSAAMFHELRGWSASDRTPPGAPRRQESDRAVLTDIAERLGVLA